MYSNHEAIADTQKMGSYPKELKDLQRHLYFQELVGKSAVGTTGLGYGTRYEDTSERKLLTNMVRTFDEESLICSLFDKKRQNLFLTWENTMAFDTTWNNVIYQLSPELLKFHVNAIHDTASTPSNLKLWNKAASGNCKLCSKQGTLNHILTFCKVALRQGRFNWRHNQVLREIMKTVSAQIEEFNSDTAK